MVKLLENIEVNKILTVVLHTVLIKVWFLGNYIKAVKKAWVLILNASLTTVL